MRQRYSLSQIVDLESRFRTNFINSLTGFKSLALVGTVDAAQQTNLAVFSQIFHLGANPALIGMIVRPDVSPRHTLENIEQVGYYTLNHVTADFYQKAHQTAARYAKEVSEFEAVGLTPEWKADFAAPFVAESQVQIGLKLEEKHELLINGTILVIGSIQEVFVAQQYVGIDGFVDLEQAGSLTSSGLDSYHKTQKIARLSYAKPYQPLKEV
ncbi:flavin reductase family protein [Hugenholtzia roseola]|uniref:flavin reductase family protein n=1 Tax=Hugenholtzia roseola TaxID=1002 RepID=UPI000478BE69|nr:flavin reductase [Hugenholtzia roseola]